MGPVSAWLPTDRRFVLAAAVTPCFVLVVLRLSAVAGDVSLVDTFFEPKFVARQAPLVFLGPFTRDPGEAMPWLPLGPAVAGACKAERTTY